MAEIIRLNLFMGTKIILLSWTIFDFTDFVTSRQTCDEAQYVRQRHMDGYIGNNSISEHHAGGVVKCAELCRRTGRTCLSFFYAPDIKKCQLQSELFSRKMGGRVSSANTSYYIDSKYVTACRGWLMQGTSCYKVVSNETDQHTAEETCNQLKEGSHLVEINTEEENAFLYLTMLTDTPLSFWLPNITANRWDFSSRPVEFTNWEPSLFAVDPNKCQMIIRVNSFKWVVHECSQKSASICEYRFVD